MAEFSNGCPFDIPEPGLFPDDFPNATLRTAKKYSEQPRRNRLSFPFDISTTQSAFTINIPEFQKFFDYESFLSTIPEVSETSAASPDLSTFRTLEYSKSKSVSSNKNTSKSQRKVLQKTEAKWVFLLIFCRIHFMFRIYFIGKMCDLKISLEIGELIRYFIETYFAWLA